METKPLQILFRGDAVNTVAKLQKETGSSSKAEVIRDAVVLYEMIASIAVDGEVIVRAKDSGKEKLITIPRKKPTAKEI